MARSMWSGVISFGMVSIPIKLYTATESHNVAFHQLHAECETRIKERRWCPNCDEEVAWEDVVKGFEYSKGEYVVLTESDLKNIPLSSKHTVEVSAFVPRNGIDPVFFDSTYYVDLDQKGAQKPYKLLLDVMEAKDVVGIATITFRNKERVCALRPDHGRMCLHTLLYADEVKSNDTDKPSVSVSGREMEMAESLVKALSSDFEPDQFKDHYQEALKKVIQSKLKGKNIEISRPREATSATDLMELLEASLAKSKNKGKTAETGGKKVAARTRRASSKKTTARKKKGRTKTGGRTKAA